MTDLTEHFSEAEFLTSQTAKFYKIKNDWQSLEHKDNAIKLCREWLEPLRELFDGPIIITSGYRVPELNTRVGGVPNSAHQYGLAVDFVIPRSWTTSIFEIIKLAIDDKRIKAPDQLILEKGWIHLGIKSKDTDNRKHFLRLYK